jgi:hypothetical protein
VVVTLQYSKIRDVQHPQGTLVAPGFDPEHPVIPPGHPSLGRRWSIPGTSRVFSRPGRKSSLLDDKNDKNGEGERDAAVLTALASRKVLAECLACLGPKTQHAPPLSGREHGEETHGWHPGLRPHDPHRAPSRLTSNFLRRIGGVVPTGYRTDYTRLP